MNLRGKTLGQAKQQPKQKVMGNKQNVKQNKTSAAETLEETQRQAGNKTSSQRLGETQENKTSSETLSERKR